MKGLFLRIVAGLCLLLWAIDMVFPWQHIMHSEENPYQAIQERGKLVVGTINHPISYFINGEGESGLEYELSKAFASYLNVELEMRPMESTDTLFDALDEHKIDIAAANLFYQTDKAEHFQLGPSYYSASWQLAYRVDKKLTQEELLLQVAEGKIAYTLANSLDISATQQIKPQIAVAFDLTDEMSVHWYLSNNSSNELQSALLDFMNTAIDSGLIANIEEKYFNHFRQFDYVDTKSYLNSIEAILPKFEPLFTKHKGNLDWRLLAAIAYQESHWNPDATSPTGVRGMMMLTKDTAERMKITDRTDPEQSIKAGSEYLHWLIEQIPDSINNDDRIWFALAAYNMGLGHLLDARRLTKSLGGNADNWLDVKKNLPLLAEKRYYTNLKYGYARGYEAVQYVENIRRYMNSIMNYYRVQQNQSDKNEDVNNNSSTNSPAEENDHEQEKTLKTE